MKQKLETALKLQERNQNEWTDMAKAYADEENAIRKLEKSLAELPDQKEWMPEPDMKEKEIVVKKELQKRKDNQYRIELKKIKAETILSIMQNNLNEATRLIDLVGTMKYPWN